MNGGGTTPLGRPSCFACGHDLSGATESARCPECGRPLVEVLVRGGGALGRRGQLVRRHESSARLFGMPLVSIALGIDASGKMGHARGYIAIGDVATGVIAIGGFARGLVAFGGLAIGGATFGGLSLGTFAAFGGLAIAWLGSACGGAAAGLLAHGGLAIGGVAQGGLAVGWLARGARAFGTHIDSMGGRGAPAIRPDAAAQALFDQFAWIIGPPGRGPMIHYGVAWTLALAIVFAVIVAIPAVLARKRGATSAFDLTAAPPPERR